MSLTRRTAKRSRIDETARPSRMEATQTMRIAQIALEGSGKWPGFRAESINERLSVFTGPPNTGKTTLAEFLGHVLYGKATETAQRTWRQREIPEGEILVVDETGRYRLRRYTDGPPPGRLTISSLNGEVVGAEDLRRLLGNLSPEILPDLYAIDFARIARHAWLPSADFAKAFYSTIGTPGIVEHELPIRNHHASTWTYRDPQRGEQLLDRRERLTRQLEEGVVGDSRRLEEWDRRLRDLDATLHNRETEMAECRRQLAAIDASLAELAQWFPAERYQTLIERQFSKWVPCDLEAQITEVESQIEILLRQIDDLNRRDKAVQAQLSKLDGGPSVAVLRPADQQARAALIGELVGELTVEVGKLADQSTASSLSRELWKRLLPLCEAAQEQTSALEQSTASQHRAVRRRDWQLEKQHLERLRLEFMQQRDHLQTRRQRLLAYRQPVKLFLQQHSDRRQQRERELTLERDQLLDALSRSELAIEELSRSRAGVVRDRMAAVAGSPSVEQIRGELRAIQEELEQLLVPPARSSVVGHPTRASDYLDRMSLGRLIELRRDSLRGHAYAISRDGGRHAIESLATRDRVLAHLAMVLAILDEHWREGIQLPLILDEPFAALSDPEQAAVAEILVDFSKQGRQVLVFTSEHAAAERFRKLRIDVHRMAAFQRVADSIDVRPGIADVVVRKPRDHEPEQMVASYEGCLLTFQSPIASFPVIGRGTEQRLLPLGIHTVEDLLDADAAKLSGSLDLPEVTTEVVEYWQTLLMLMCYVPGLALDDAQVLCDSGSLIRSPEDLAEVDLAELENQIRTYLASSQGASWRKHGYIFDRRQLDTWQYGARRNRQRWRTSKYHNRSSSRARTTPVPSRAPAAAERNGSSSPSITPTSHADRESWRFYLEPDSDIEAAPSIGPKTAARFYDIGIGNVQEFLAADPSETAEQLNARHITANLIATWQQQARLMCEVPRLRGHDAQILVACELTEPSRIAELSPSQLLARVTPFCDSEKGKRLLRNGKRPDLHEVTDWIESCRQRRPVHNAG